MTMVFQSLDGRKNYNPDFAATNALPREAASNSPSMAVFRLVPGTTEIAVVGAAVRCRRHSRDHGLTVRRGREFLRRPAPCRGSGRLSPRSWTLRLIPAVIRGCGTLQADHEVRRARR